MLKLFEVAGFKNFGHKFSLNFSDVRDYKFNEHCIKDGLLKNCIIYGKNSSGKTNFGLAIFDIVAHLTGNHVSTGLYDNYLNSDNSANIAYFQYVFQFGSDIVDYSYEKSSNKTLISEKLLLNGLLILKVRYSSSRIIESDISGLSKLAPTLDLSFYTGGSMLRLVLSNAMLGATHPLYKMLMFVSKMLWFRGLRQLVFIGHTTDIVDYYKFMLDDKSVLAEFQELLISAGINSNLTVEKDPHSGQRNLYSHTGSKESGKIPFIPTASSGTKALYTLFYWHKTALDTSLLFIDEFDAYYHFELAETIVKLLGKRPNTQVLLTSHNTNLLTNRIMRPDCYFILTPEKLTSFANATNRELREGHNLEKLYASGEFYE